MRLPSSPAAAYPSCNIRVVCWGGSLISDQWSGIQGPARAGHPKTSAVEQKGKKAEWKLGKLPSPFNSPPGGMSCQSSAPWETSQGLSCSEETGPQWCRLPELHNRDVRINPRAYAFWFYQQSLCLTFLSTAAAELHGWSSCLVPKRPLLKPYPKSTRGLLSTPDRMAGTSVFVIILLCPFPISFPVTMYLWEFWLLLMEKSFWVTM